MEVVALAHGKVLITGGYLILERPNAGIVFTTTPCFYAIVKPLDSINPFVKQAVQYAIAAFKVILSEKEKLQKLLLQGLDITILGSNDFYSCRDQGCCVEYITLVGDNLASIFPDASLNPLLCGIPQPLLFFPLFGSRTLAYYPTSQVTLLFGSRTLA
ncbi:hypothetical protein ZIOFF_075786 [Zingiber officinale]|uniref:Uncharacterized protein n=1 Tax=Zingiber officinale TaxID=94328 RepID=A0A8J5BST8_ZINOF|nr:hypothetical protein ZIOFF_075786 [Zingiber officinale]